MNSRQRRKSKRLYSKSSMGLNIHSNIQVTRRVAKAMASGDVFSSIDDGFGTLLTFDAVSDVPPPMVFSKVEQVDSAFDSGLISDSVRDAILEMLKQ